MSNANQLINSLAAENTVDADNAFTALLQDKIQDALEVTKVELASTIMADMVEEEVVQEGEGMDAQRRWVRQVAAIGKEGNMKPMHRDSLKAVARKYFKTYQPHGAAFVEKGAQAVKGARQILKQKRLQGEETITEEHTAAHELSLYADNDSHLHRTSHQPIIANLKKKIAKGVYDHSKAVKLWGYHADRAAHKYAKEHGDGTPWHKMFTPADRKQAAQHFADRAKEELGLEESTVVEAVDTGSQPTNAQLNRNVLTNLRKAVQTLKVSNVNPVQAAAAHRDFGKLVAKNPKAPGYMLLRKLAPQKAQAVQSLTQAGVPLGGALEAHPNDFNQALQRIKRFK